jgi:hypothetical protein
MSDQYIVGHTPVFHTAKKYVDAKVRILKRDFCIRPTEEEIEHLYTLKTQTAIDNAVLSIINHHWN